MTKHIKQVASKGNEPAEKTRGDELTLEDLESYLDNCEDGVISGEKVFPSGGIVFDSQPECGDAHELTWVDCWPGGKDSDGGFEANDRKRHGLQTKFALALLAEWATKYDLPALGKIAKAVKAGAMGPADILGPVAEAFAEAGWGAYEWSGEAAIEMWRLSSEVKAAVLAATRSA